MSRKRITKTVPVELPEEIAEEAIARATQFDELEKKEAYFREYVDIEFEFKLSESTPEADFLRC